LEALVLPLKEISLPSGAQHVVLVPFFAQVRGFLIPFPADCEC
jgi:hypothetical protein